MAQCNITDLLNRGKCFECLTPGEIFPIKLALLCSIAQARIPGYDCSVNTLLRNSSCFLCLPYPMQKILKLQLLCRLVGPPIPPTPPVTDFKNVTTSQRTDCAGGPTLGLPACVTINAGVFTSTVSQADADAQANALATSLKSGMDTGHCCAGNPTPKTRVQDFDWVLSNGGQPGDTPWLASQTATPSTSASGFAEMQSGVGDPTTPWIAKIQWVTDFCSAWDDYTATLSFDWVATGLGSNSDSVNWFFDLDAGTVTDSQSIVANSSGHHDFTFTIKGNGSHNLLLLWTANKTAPTNSPGNPKMEISNVTLRPLVPPVQQNCTIVSSTNPPANDNFSAAITIAGASGQTTGSNVFATHETGEPALLFFGLPSVNSIWYNWTAPANGTATFNTNGSNYDTALACYTGGSVSTLTQIAANFIGPRPNQSQISFAATSGTTYRIRVDGLNGAQGNVTLTWSLV